MLKSDRKNINIETLCQRKCVARDEKEIYRCVPRSIVREILLDASRDRHIRDVSRRIDGSIDRLFDKSPRGRHLRTNDSVDDFSSKLSHMREKKCELVKPFKARPSLLIGKSLLIESLDFHETISNHSPRSFSSFFETNPFLTFSRSESFFLRGWMWNYIWFLLSFFYTQEGRSDISFYRFRIKSGDNISSIVSRYNILYTIFNILNLFANFINYYISLILLFFT